MAETLDHLIGTGLPNLTLPATHGSAVTVDQLGPDRTVIYVYPMTGRPGVDVPAGWDEIPGARGCTAEACSFSDHHDELRRAGAAAVYGLSSQTTDYQREAVDRLHLRFAMLADPELKLASSLGLPTFEVGGSTYFQRLTLVVSGGQIEHVFFPVDQPGEHAADVLTWLQERARSAAS